MSERGAGWGEGALFPKRLLLPQARQGEVSFLLGARPDSSGPEESQDSGRRCPGPEVALAAAAALRGCHVLG